MRGLQPVQKSACCEACFRKVFSVGPSFCPQYTNESPYTRSNSELSASRTVLQDTDTKAVPNIIKNLLKVVTGLFGPSKRGIRDSSARPAIPIRIVNPGHGFARFSVIEQSCHFTYNARLVSPRQTDGS